MGKFRTLVARLEKWLATAFWFALAIIFLIESWIWDHVKEWLRQLERALGLERLEPWLQERVAALSPQMTLALFAIPMLAVLPVKLAAMAMLAQGHVISGVIFIFLIKSLTLGVEAFLFDICREKLLQMEWFARVYSIVLDIRAWALLMVKPMKLQALQVWTRLRDQALSLGAGGALKQRIARLREAVRQRTRV